jgi:hypothetical protein
MLVCGTPHHHRRFAWIPLIDWANPDNSSFFSANALAMQADDGATLCVDQHTPFATSRSLCERFNQFAIDSVWLNTPHLPSAALCVNVSINLLLTVCVVDASHMFSHVHSCLSFPFTLVCCISILLVLCNFLLAHFRFSSRYFFLLSLCSLPTPLHSLSRVRRRHQLATN